MSEELKLCKCGAGATELIVWGNAETGPFSALCLNCYKEGPTRDTEAEAITAWNTRAGEKA